MYEGRQSFIAHDNMDGAVDMRGAEGCLGYQKRDGFEDVNNGLGPNTENRVNDRNVYTLRGQYLINITDAADLLMIGDYSKRNEACCAAVVVASGPFAGIADAVAQIPALGGNGDL